MKKTKISLLVLFVLCKIILIGQNDTFTDIRDGNRYELIKAGNLIWFTENLKFETENAFQLIENDTIKQVFYTNHQLDSLCPSPFRVPTAKEWEKAIKDLYAVKKVTYKKTRKNNSLIFKLKMDSSLEDAQKLKIQRTGWVEGKQQVAEGAPTYWINERNKKNYHIHFGPKAFSEHTHKHHIEDVAEKRRQFLVRCVCESVKLEKYISKD